MTVQQLIDRLSGIQDKSLVVLIEGCSQYFNGVLNVDDTYFEGHLMILMSNECWEEE